MQLYASYLKERENAELIAYDWGFAVYKFFPDYCYLQDVFVQEGRRTEGLGVRLEAEVIAAAKKANLKWLYGSIDPQTKFATSMMQIMLGLKYKLSHTNGGLIYMKKEI